MQISECEIFLVFLCFSRFYSFIYSARGGRRKKLWNKTTMTSIAVAQCKWQYFLFSETFSAVSGIHEIDARNHWLTVNFLFHESPRQAPHRKQKFNFCVYHFSIVSAILSAHIFLTKMFFGASMP